MRTILFLFLSIGVCIGQPFTFNDGAFLGAAASQSQILSSPSSLLSGIGAYWTLDNSGSYVDSAGGGYTLTKNGTVNTIAGIISNGASFTNNTANTLSRADDDVFSAINSVSITFVAWVNLNVTNAYSGIIAKDNGATTGREYQLVYNANPARWEFAVSTNSASYAKAVTPTVAHQTAVWYFLAAFIDNTNKVAKLRQGTITELGDWGSSATFAGYGPDGTGTNGVAEFKIGIIGGSLPANASIDEVGYWQRVLTDQEITNVWNNGAGKTYPF